MSVVDDGVKNRRGLRFDPVWSRRLLRRAGVIVAFVIVGTVAVAFLMPMYWMFTGSFKLQLMTMQVPPEIIPTRVTLKNYYDLFTSAFPVFRWMLNSIIVSLGTVFLTLLVSSLTGYSFGKKTFPGQSVLFFILLSCMMLPKQVTLIPLLIFMRDLGLRNTYLGMILPLAASPFGIFLMKQFMSSIPNELIDAARIDGASEWGIYWRVIVPLSKPVFGTLGIFSFMTAWNDFMWQLIMASDLEMMTMTVGVNKLAFQPMGEMMIRNYGLIMACGVFGALPMIAIFIAFQRYFVQGITVGAVKG